MGLLGRLHSEFKGDLQVTTAAFSALCLQAHSTAELLSSAVSVLFSTIAFVLSGQVWTNETTTSVITNPKLT